MGCNNQNSDASPLRPASAPFADEERKRIIAAALARMVMIGGKVYGIEDEAEPEAPADCLSRLQSCRAMCCTYVFALTQAEVKAGHVEYNPDRPYYIARDEDGYCPHLDRTTFMCSIHDRRPLRCRKFACSLR